MADPRAQSGLRIGLFAHRLTGKQPTGVGRYIQELVRALERVPGTGELIAASTREADEATWVPPGVVTRMVRWPRRPVQLLWALGTGPRLEGSVGGLDVMHLLQPFPPVRSAAAQVVTVHDLFPIEHPDWYPRLERWTHERSISLLQHRATRIVVPSAYVAERVREVLAVETKSVTVVPLGLSSMFTSGTGEADGHEVCRRIGVSPGDYAVCVGSVSTRKNLVTLIRAMAQKNAPEMPLVMIGPDGHGVDEVEREIARQPQRRGRVVRTGYLPDSDVATLVQGAAVLLHAALGEGFGLVPLEAMAAGTPVIAAGTGSVPELVGRAAVLVEDPLDPTGWAEALSDLMGDPRRRQDLARAGLERAQQFSWDETARRMMDEYRAAAQSEDHSRPAQVLRPDDVV